MIVQEILNIAKEKGLQTERLALLHRNNEIHRVLINPHLKYPRVLFLGYKSGENPAIPYGVARFLSKVPCDVYKHIGIEIIPIVNPVNIPLEKKIINRIVKGKVYSMCICLKEYADSPHSLRLETTDRCEVVSQRILETSEFIFKTELKIDKINPSDRQNLEENIYIRTETPIIRVNLPSLYEFYDRVTGVSRIMEDCIHESLYDFRKPISILDRMLRKST
jgi:hypothetical protein